MTLHRQSAPKKLNSVTCLYLALLVRVHETATWIKAWAEIKASKYTIQLGQPDIPPRWRHAAATVLHNQPQNGVSQASSAVAAAPATPPHTAALVAPDCSATPAPSCAEVTSSREFEDVEAANGDLHVDAKPNFLGGALLAALLVSILLFLSGCSVADARDEWPAADSLATAQREQALAERIQCAAQATCTDDFGPQVVAVWLSPTEFECVNARGRRLSHNAKESQHVAR